MNKFKLSIISIIITAVSSVAAAFTVYQTAKSYRIQLEANRPYLMVVDQGIKVYSSDISPSYGFVFNLKNIGARPAAEYSEKMIQVPLESELKGEINIVTNLSISNEIAPGEIVNLVQDNVEFGSSNIKPYYFVVAIKYKDTLTQKVYKQNFVYSWKGVRENICYPDLKHVSNSETVKVLKYLERDLLEFR